MTITTKGRYGLSLMLDVMENQSVAPVRLKDAANRQNISENCPDIILWGKINDAIHSVVDHVTLADMREWGA